MTAARPLRVVVTRPAAQAGTWLAGLRGAGIHATALPLIEILPAAKPAALARAWASLAAHRLVVFVSANAVLHFFAGRPANSAWPAALSAAAPGPGTSDALRDAGLADSAIVAPADDAAQFDSEALWLRLRERDWQGASVLVVRGDGGREWLGERLAEAGAKVEAVSAYRRGLPVFTAGERALLDELSAAPDVAWLFSSAQAVTNLEHTAGSGRWAAARAVATHPRIAARALEAGFGRVDEVGPGLAATVACIQSWRP